LRGRWRAQIPTLRRMWGWVGCAAVAAPDRKERMQCPTFVEDDLDYWLNTVGQYCPWGA
jgi:hypothetical protein